MTAQRQLRDGTAAVTFLAFPHSCVEIAGDGARSSLPSAQLLDRLLDIMELRHAKAAVDSPHTALLEDVALWESGADSLVDHALARLVREKKAMNRVAVAYAGDGRLFGGEVVWLDAGDRGVWVIEPVDDETVSFQPAAPEDVGRSLLGLLPRRATPSGP